MFFVCFFFSCLYFCSYFMTNHASIFVFPHNLWLFYEKTNENLTIYKKIQIKTVSKYKRRTIVNKNMFMMVLILFLVSGVGIENVITICGRQLIVTSENRNGNYSELTIIHGPRCIQIGDNNRIDFQRKPYAFPEDFS